MPHYGILREQKLEGVDDLRGTEVYGVNDEKLGTIDDVIFDHSTGEIRYIVLKTGGLLSRRKVMLPANRIEPYGQDDDKFYAELGKEQLDMLPEFKEETLKADAAWSAYEKEYEKLWTENPTMYKKVTGRIITPPHEEEINPAHQEAQRQANQRKVMSPVGSEIEIPQDEPPISTRESMREPGVYKLDPVVETEQGAGPVDPQNINLGRRWNDFQRSLRVVRGRIVLECPRCASHDKAA